MCTNYLCYTCTYHLITFTEMFVINVRCKYEIKCQISCIKLTSRGQNSAFTKIIRWMVKDYPLTCLISRDHTSQNGTLFKCIQFHQHQLFHLLCLIISCIYFSTSRQDSSQLLHHIINQTWPNNSITFVVNEIQLKQFWCYWATVYIYISHPLPVSFEKISNKPKWTRTW